MENVYLGLGSNMGDRLKYIVSSIKLLTNHPKISLLKESSLYETKPFGYTNQPDFLNMAIKVETSLSPIELLNYIHEIEATLDRKRLVHWGPRTIDVDILLYGDNIIKSDVLTIPHLYLTKRLFVMIPLSEIYYGKIPGETLSLDYFINKIEKEEGEIEIMEGVSKRIRAFRKLKGLTQLELADKIGVSVAVLGSIERGAKKPELFLLEKISEALEINIDELIQN